MRAVTVLPGTPDSARLDDVPDSDQSLGSVLVEAEAGPKPELVRALGATYHRCGVLELPFSS